MRLDRQRIDIDARHFDIDSRLSQSERSEYRWQVTTYPVIHTFMSFIAFIWHSRTVIKVIEVIYLENHSTIES